MLNENELFVCPYCKTKLDKIMDGYSCSKCDIVYPIIDKIPIFVDWNKLDDLKREDSEFFSEIATERMGKDIRNPSLRFEYLHDDFLKFFESLPAGSTILDVACGGV